MITASSKAIAQLAMPNRHYNKAPITEAVFAFHFSTPLDQRVRERFHVKRRKLYPRIEEMRTVKVDLGLKVAVEYKAEGQKFTSEDGLSVVILTNEQMSICRLAPYVDWNNLQRSVEENWAVLLSVLSRPQLKTLSTRFINRVDVPAKRGSSPIDPNDFFNLAVQNPKHDFQILPANFHLQTVITSKDGRFQHNISLGTLVPPLIDQTSFLLDIDTSAAFDMPSRQDDIWEIVLEMRARKNECFEACITDNSRKLFE